ncbi:hypothetical protein BGZ73_004291 [Actinomortierella ambigua]|nr:hypothetical protein BGZ73_004291 [Actinomortierella ambigua]
MKLPTVAVLALSLSIFPTNAQTINSTDPTNPGNAICNTEECKSTAAEILANMNPSADPCQDFYEFTCGGFMQTKAIPPGETGTSTWQFEKNRNITREILEANPSTLKGMDGQPLDTTSLRNLEKIQSFYQSCMNETQLVAVGAKPLLDELQQLVTTVFPVPGSSFAAALANNTVSSPPSSQQIDRQTLTSALAQLMQTRVESVISVGVTEDALAPETQTAIISEAGLSLPTREMYQEPAITQVLQGVVQQMFLVVLGPKGVTNATAEQWAKEVVTFEGQLANISTSSVDMSTITKMWNPMTVEQLEQLNGGLDWRLLLNKTLSIGTNGSHPYMAGSNKTLVVSSPPFQQKLAQLLNQTSAETVQKYFAWKTILGRYNNLAQVYRAPMDALSAILKGSDPSRVPDRWKTCLSNTNSYLGALVGYFYVAQQFTAEDKATMIEIIDTLKQTYLADMPTTTWLDNQTRANAITKLQAMTPLVGYSMADPNVSSPADLATYFGDVAVQAADYYGSVGSANKAIVLKNWGKIDKKTNREYMFANPQTINAFYYPTTNQVLFPAAFMQKPVYTRGNPEYLNYGAVGFVAAHEITHGFDSNGRQFDETGKLNNWWTNETAAQFVSRAQCFVDQYSSFNITNPKTNQSLFVNGQLTLGENIADNGGVRKAYDTWYRRFKGSASNSSTSNISQNQILPGLEKYTRDQLFFISYGQVWCAKNTPEIDKLLLTIDTHAPARWRVNGPAQNTPAFAQAFKCAEGAPMNPVKKCAVW